MSRFSENISRNLQEKGFFSPSTAPVKELYEAVSRAAMAELAETWHKPQQKKRACYLSAEFLVCRLIKRSFLRRIKIIVHMNAVDIVLFNDFPHAINN